MEYNNILIYVLCTLTVFLIQIGAFIYGFWKKQKPVMYNKGKLIKYMDLYFVYYPQKTGYYCRLSWKSLTGIFIIITMSVTISFWIIAIIAIIFITTITIGAKKCDDYLCEPVTNDILFNKMIYYLMFWPINLYND